MGTLDGGRDVSITGLADMFFTCKSFIRPKGFVEMQMDNPEQSDEEKSDVDLARKVKHIGPWCEGSIRGVGAGFRVVPA